jgi:hypothetical protein
MRFWILSEKFCFKVVGVTDLFSVISEELKEKVYVRGRRGGAF